jgi:hypothetical protein
MDVIGFLCVSLGSSTVQFHDSLRSRGTEAGFSCQNGDRASGVYYRKAAFYCASFCGERDSMQRTFIRKCFLFTVGNVCRVKQFTTGSRNFLKDVLKPQVIPYQVQTGKHFYAAGFDTLVKR